MKVCIAGENYREILNNLKKKGSVILVEKGEGGEEKLVFSRDCIKFGVKPKNLREVLEVLADLGYSYALLKGFDDDEVKNIGISIPRISKAEEIEDAEDVESLKSLIGKLKDSQGSEFCGAIGVFIGFVRKIQDGREVVRLEYEKFDDIYDRVRREIESEVEKMDGVRAVRIYHKTGAVVPKEDIVYVLVMADHRKNLWEALQKAVELFKEKLPVWKKEVYVDGEIWAHDRDLNKGS